MDEDDGFETVPRVVVQDPALKRSSPQKQRQRHTGGAGSSADIRRFFGGRIAEEEEADVDPALTRNRSDCVVVVKDDATEEDNGECIDKFDEEDTNDGEEEDDLEASDVDDTGNIRGLIASEDEECDNQEHHHARLNQMTQDSPTSSPIVRRKRLRKVARTPPRSIRQKPKRKIPTPESSPALARKMSEMSIKKDERKRVDPAKLVSLFQFIASNMFKDQVVRKETGDLKAGGNCTYDALFQVSHPVKATHIFRCTDGFVHLNQVPLNDILITNETFKTLRSKSFGAVNCWWVCGSMTGISNASDMLVWIQHQLQDVGIISVTTDMNGNFRKVQVYNPKN